MAETTQKKRMMMKEKHLSWIDVEASCLDMYKGMLDDCFVPDAIIGLLRGGVVPARIFSDSFGILMDFYAIDVKLYTGIGERNEKPVIKPFHIDITGKKILIVDDIWDSGRTMEAVLEELKGEDVTTATLYWKESAPAKPDYYYEPVKDDDWIIFPWEKDEFSRLKEERNK